MKNCIHSSVRTLKNTQDLGRLMSQYTDDSAKGEGMYSTL